MFFSITMQTILSYSFILQLKQNEYVANNIINHNYCKNLTKGKNHEANAKFMLYVYICSFIVMLIAWLSVLLLSAGDIHPNPGPSSSISSVTTSSISGISSTFINSLNISHHLSFVHYNVQSLASKLDVLHAELFHFDILAFTETWLNSSFSTSYIRLQSFNSPERKDRVGDSHGGVIIYVKEGLHYRRRQDLEPRGIECIWIELSNNHKRTLFGLFYRPPNSDLAYYSLIENSLHLAVDSGINDIIITGDFNFNMLHPQSSRKIHSFCTQFALFQAINEPTHFTETSSSLLDILLVSNNSHLIVSGVADSFLNQEHRYHCPIFGIYNFSKPKSKSFTRHIWKYDQGDYNLLRNKAAFTDWVSLEDNDINTHANNVTDYILSISKLYIPNKNIKVRPSDPPWLTTFIKRYIRKRKRAYRKAKQTDLQYHWDKFRKLRNKVVSLIKESKRTCDENIAKKLKSDSLTSTDWWSTLKTVISPTATSSIPPLESNGRIYTDEQDKANLLNNYFKEQTLLDDSNAELPALPPYNIESTLNSIILTPLEVESVLKSLPIGKASGPNGLSNRILKELSKELAFPLCVLFNRSLSQGEVPRQWKEANICPIHKKDDPSLVSNYRPISLLNSEDKVFERLIFKHLYNHLRDNNVLSSLQSGFIQGDSTVNQLTFLYNTFCQALDMGKEVRVVFCDIRKAFDRVWHAGLLHKLKAAGVQGELLKWFTNYLAERKQRVILPGVASDWTYILAGVPQGSILGPILFLIYINDIVAEIGSNIRLFADDTSLYIIVENPITSAVCLNSDLSKISIWANNWLVDFYPIKTESMLISRKLNKPVHPPLFMQEVQIA